jgi:hypothetical protein
MAPLWATPDRQANLAHLVSTLLTRQGEITIDLFSGKLDIPKMEEAIRVWIALDREEREASWRRERRLLHTLPPITHRGQFDSIAREIFLAQRPLWRIEAIGIGAFTFQRVLKVNIPGLDKVIWVNLPSVGKVPKHRKRRFLRYGKGSLPEADEDWMFRVVSEAVNRALSN